jgi:hypothetical protein
MAKPDPSEPIKQIEDRQSVGEAGAADRSINSERCSAVPAPPLDDPAKLPRLVVEQTAARLATLDPALPRRLPEPVEWATETRKRYHR